MGMLPPHLKSRLSLLFSLASFSLSLFVSLDLLFASSASISSSSHLSFVFFFFPSSSLPFFFPTFSFPSLGQQTGTGTGFLALCFLPAGLNQTGLDFALPAHTQKLHACA